MRHAHTVDIVRTAEAALMARLPEGALMQRAAAGLAAVCAQLLGGVYGSRVVLLVGSGDNGGDALFAGARLAERGASVEAVLLSPDRAHAGGLAALRSAGGTVREHGDQAAAAFTHVDLVVDGIVGIGGRGGLRSAAAALAEALHAAGTTVVAVDVPSGVDASTGRVDGVAIRADVTVTFGTYKPGLLVDPGAALAGVVELVDIGLGPYLGDADVLAPQAADIAERLPVPTGESDKYRRGVVGVLAGSDAYTGAAVLAVGGALRSGAGMVRFVSTPRVVDLVRARWPEVVAAIGSVGDTGRVQAWVVGPGIGTDEQGECRLDDVLDTDVPVLVDADGLTLLASRGKLDRAAPVVLTPHAGEAARLLGDEWSAADVEARRLEAARRCAERYGATVLLKGATTVVADGSGPVLVNPTGTSWLATAGSGDVLSGLAGSLLAAGLAPLDAASAAAFLHGLAARLALAEHEGPITAVDVITWLPAAWSAVSGRIDGL
jgi:ADP-dependent NAD(P)H-hydrate dehydratase / NAD(P)H-hydrate epimerase